ncbi:hypothetical protein B0T17DRAFT_498807 [Bombardia bombarda]|uniref:C2H2-type domain-containing protein n=1 Tax=Bombardia bombarda TaxID=252184 RepID=A0AA39U7M5_9PEZI|nr:hypothetical protein B0T17DRAFT_498807 [Bombardia bombarda]
MPMCDLQLDFGDGEGFNFGSQPMACPPSSSNGSPYTSSTYGPYTPTSGRSTPPPHRSGSMDFACSFGSSVDSLPYNLTPPSSAMSAYFPMDLGGNDGTDFFQGGIPVTPSRNAPDFSGFSLGSCGGQLTPSQSMEFYSFSNELGHSPVAPTPIQNVQDFSAWAQADSPINFEKQPSPAVNNTLRSMAQARQDGKRRRRFTEEAKHKTAALCTPQRAQQEYLMDVRPHMMNDKSPGDLITRPVNTIPAGGFKCDWPSCTHNKKYQRKEHMKRHVKSEHLKELYPCNFCSKIFNRNDNRTQHHKLHFKNDRRAPRVAYIAGAEKVIEEKMKNSKPRKSAKTKA